MSCALCGTRASIFCESDQAKLCGKCDETVHSANFLVEKHTRVLLCQVCHSSTPWKASGRKFGVSLSLCHDCSFSTAVSSALTSVILEIDRCSPLIVEKQGYNLQDDDARSASVEGEDGPYSDDSDGEEEDDDDDDETDESEDSEDEEDNQVVPWTLAETPTPPPARPSSSSSEDAGNNQSPSGWRRIRNSSDYDSDLDSEDEASLIQAAGGANLLPLPESFSSDEERTSPARKRPRTRATLTRHV